MRTMARLMMSAAVPWSGALIAARSAEGALRRVLVVDARQMAAAAEGVVT